ncbi:uncharacterized protein LOC142230179 [Haematobia irritans]|uniref:uncharacterized protein LOC142230179 n=1 Tax=Haematobia irritans TaxID=7368 RepID=UPI003F4FC8AE
MSCAICFDRFKGSDDLYSTTCGHVYHHLCMQEWKNRSSSCPQCRVNHPGTHKIYLELDDTDIKKLESELIECRKQNENLKLQLRQRKSFVQTPKIRELEETLNDALAHNAVIIEQLKSSETEKTHLQNICIAHENELSVLNETLLSLSVEKNTLTQKCKDLEDRCARAHSSNVVSATDNASLHLLIRQTSILITGAQVHSSSKLLNYILYLAHKMDLHYTRQDIVRAGRYRPDELIVQFRYPHIKDEFVANEYRLRWFDETNEIEFLDLLVGEDINYDSLFEYALNLKLFGYKSVFRRNDKIFTIRTEYDDAIRIYSKEHVNDLISEVK